MSNLKILHFVQDEKFTDGIIDEFDSIGDGSVHFYAICKKKKTPLKFVSEKSSERISWISGWKIRRFLKANQINVVVLHNIFSLHYRWILSLPSKVKIVWFAWGKDIYCYPRKRPFVPLKLYHTKTDTWLQQNKFERKSIKGLIDDFFLKICLRKINYFSGVLPQEYEMMKSYNNTFDAKEVFFSYRPLSKKPVYSVDEQRCLGLNLLIGNSGDETNNHLDIFEKLSGLDLTGKKIYVPLSYGGSRKYVSYVINEGKKLWGDNFIPLNTFVSEKQYSEIISSCGIRIFGHERQQAIGNIGLALRSGCKVFLSETSVGYAYYKSIGIDVFSIQQDLVVENINDSLSTVAYEKNVSQMLLHRSNYVSYTNLMRTFKIIEQDMNQL